MLPPLRLRIQRKMGRTRGCLKLHHFGGVVEFVFSLMCDSASRGGSISPTPESLSSAGTVGPSIF
jgi:hypothetical protein